MTVTVRALEHTASIGGNAVDTMFSYRFSTGFDLSVGEAQIDMATWAGGNYYDSVVLNINGDDRWTGILVSKEFNLYPRRVTANCRDPLFLAEQFQVPEEVEDGVLLADIAGGPATDQTIVTNILIMAGLGGYLGGIGGTGTTLGTVAAEEFTWRSGESALSYIQRLDQICLGYRTYWNGTEIVRQQVSSRPSGGESATLTEGEDIISGSSSRTIMEAHNAVRVGGYAVGDYADPRVWYQVESNPYQGGAHPDRVFNFDSPMIERRADASPGLGLSCEAVAGYFLGELNRELVKVQLATPRSDIFRPGDVHLVQGGGGSADRLGVGEKLWVQRVDGSMSTSGAFAYSLTYVGGGAE